MNLLMHRYTPWQKEIRCSTNIYAEQFVKTGHHVTYMSSILHFGRLLKGKKHSVQLLYKEGAYTFSPLTLVPFSKKPPFNTPLFADLTYLTLVPPINRLLDTGFGSPDIIWTVPPGSSALKRKFPKAKLIMQVVDYYPAFLGDGIKIIEKRDYERADHIFTIGEAMSSYLINDLNIDTKKITSLGQGVDIEKYQKNDAEPDEIKDLPHPRAIWVGLVKKGDKVLFEETAKAIESMGGSFIIIGPSVDWSLNLQNKCNYVVNLGSKKPEDIPMYLKYCDIGIMLYDRSLKEIYKGQHPLKLYEYAAAGLVILSTDHEEYKYINPPCDIYREGDIIKDKITQLIANQSTLQAKSLDFAAKHTWSNAFSVALDKINQLF